MEPIKKSFRGLGERWDHLTFNQKITAGTLLLALAFSTFFLYNQAHDNYDVLYSNLSETDAAATVAKLKEAKTSYRLADGGTTILVPRDRRDDMRLQTASELTSETPISLTQLPPVMPKDVEAEWLKKFNTDSISETLRSIRGIRNARVIVSKPEESVFTEKQQDPTASVMLIVEPGFRLREEQAKTIKNLVSHSVPGLKPENVALADNSGNPLEGPGGVMGNGMSEADMRRKNFEEETSKKISDVLMPIVGKGNAVVSVSARLNFDQAEAEINRMIPLGGTAEKPTGLAVSTQEETERYGSGAKKGTEPGAPGVASNAPSYPGTGATAEDKAGSDYVRQKVTTNYANSDEKKHVVYAQGTVERMTVSVVLNKVLTSKETEDIKEMVSHAAGLDLTRGDEVDIKGFQFSEIPGSKNAEMAKMSEQVQQQAFILQIAQVATVALLGLAALIIFYKLFSSATEEDAYVETPTYLYDEEAYESIEAPEEQPLSLIEAMNPEMENKRQTISGIVTRDPNEAARVLLSYMKEM